jgi:hypothetical protein
MSTITLGDIRAHGPCTSGWAKLTKALGTTDLTTELSIGDIVIANGLNDALWALRCLPRREALAAVMPAVKRASVFTTDQRVHDCISAVDLWLAGDDSVDLAAAAIAEAAAAAAAEEARAAWAAERDMQASDLLAMFPPIRLKAEVAS